VDSRPLQLFLSQSFKKFPKTGVFRRLDRAVTFLHADFGLPVLNQLPAGHANDIDGNSHRAAVAESFSKTVFDNPPVVGYAPDNGRRHKTKSFS
jgi:hypothetical protein